MDIVEQILRVMRKMKIYEWLKSNNFLMAMKRTYDGRKKRNRCKMVQRFGYDIIEEINDIFKEMNATAWIEWGTLLGFCRENQLLFHDDDIDFAVLESEINKDQFVKSMVLSGYSHVRRWTNSGSIIMDTFLKNGVLIDVDYVFQEIDGNLKTVIFEKEEKTISEYKDGKEIISGMGRYYYYTKRVEGVIEKEFYNSHKCPVPVNYLDRVRELYGDKWETPIKEYDPYCLNNYVYDGFTQDLGGWMII